MRKIAVLFCLLPVITWANNLNDKSSLSIYQALCAKEQDPIKRHQYCQMVDESKLANPRFEILRQDIAVG